MPVDWVPVVGYSVPTVVTADQTEAFQLYQVPVWASEDPSVVEHGAPSLFLHRVVGSIFAIPPAEQDVSFGWRLMPLQANVELGIVQLPYDGTLIANSFKFGVAARDIADLRFWDERVYNVTNATSTTGTAQQSGGSSRHGLYHPYWTEVDITPKQAFGARWNLWPSLVVDNTGNDFDVLFFYRLRLLVGYNG